MNGLKDRIAVITGGADGIGRATAMRFAQEGAVVVIWDMNEEKGKQTAAEINAAGGKASFLKVNTSNFAEVEAASKKVVEQYGKYEILINNAGITRDSTLKKMTPELWQQVIDVNLTGVFYCAKCAADHYDRAGLGTNSQRLVGGGSIRQLRTDELRRHQGGTYRNDQDNGSRTR